MATRITRVEDVVNMRDLALGVNDWYNVTLHPSRHGGLRLDPPGTGGAPRARRRRARPRPARRGPPDPRRPRHPRRATVGPDPRRAQTLVTVSSASDVGALAERVDHLTQELATAKAKLRALETARSGDVLSDIAERACALATSRAETAAREATAAARECRTVEIAVERAEAAAAEATKARDGFFILPRRQGGGVRVESAFRRRAGGGAHSRGWKRTQARAGGVEGRRPRHRRETHAKRRGVTRRRSRDPSRRVRRGRGDCNRGRIPGTDPRWDPRTPGPGTSGMVTPGMTTPGMAMGTLGMGAPKLDASSLMSRVAEVSARTEALSTTVDSLAAGGGAGGAAAQQLTVGLQQLHAAVGASLKERPTTTAVRAMIEERSKENDLVARVSALEAEADASANAEGAGEGERRALETINAVSRRVGVLEDNSHAMERRQQRTERVVEDVRRALDARTRREEVSTIRKIRADEKSQSDSDSDSDSESYSTPASERRRAVTATELMAGAKMTF